MLSEEASQVLQKEQHVQYPEDADRTRSSLWTEVLEEGQLTPKRDGPRMLKMCTQ